MIQIQKKEGNGEQRKMQQKRQRTDKMVDINLVSNYVKLCRWSQMPNKGRYRMVEFLRKDPICYLQETHSTCNDISRLKVKG